MADSVLYIAIDFGTSYSGYAFSFQTKQLQDQIRIPSWGTKYGQKTFKTPTCILFDEDQKFLEFGYDAMVKYTRLTKKLQAKKQYLFEHFKMELYDKVSLLVFLIISLVKYIDSNAVLFIDIFIVFLPRKSTGI